MTWPPGVSVAVPTWKTVGFAVTVNDPTVRTISPVGAGALELAAVVPVGAFLLGIV
jgi:hypothetical protein